MSTHLNVCSSCGKNLTFRDRDEIKEKIGLCHNCVFELDFALTIEEWTEHIKKNRSE